MCLYQNVENGGERADNRRNNGIGRAKETERVRVREREKMNEGEIYKLDQVFLMHI